MASLAQLIFWSEVINSLKSIGRSSLAASRITRTVALEGHAELLDLAASLADPACDAFFRPDGIHFDYCEQEENMLHDPPSQPGLQRIAEELERKIREITRSRAWQEKVSRDQHE